MTVQNFIDVLRLFYNTNKTDEEIMAFLNSLLQTIWQEIGISTNEIINVSAGLDKYSLPNNCLPSGIKRVFASDFQEYLPINLSKNSNGTYEFINEEIIKFSPVSESLGYFNIYYTCFPEVKSLTDDLHIKKDCIELAKIGTIAILAKTENKVTLANNYSHEFNELLSGLKQRNRVYLNGFPKVRDVNV